MALLLTESDVKRVLSMPDLVETMEGAVARFSGGEVVQPVRTILQAGAQHGFFGVMPAFISRPAAMGAKLVTVFGSNAARGLPTHLATIVLLDCDTGALVAILDGRYITEARTAAVSAVAVRHLARPDAARLAILGSGVQARSHVEALPQVRAFREIVVWSPQAAHRDAFVREMQPHVTPRLRTAETAEAAVRGADVVVLVTSSRQPVVQDGWVGDGACVISVGACWPDQREMDPALTARGRLFVDSRAAALVESGDVVIGMADGRFGAAHIAGELGELVLGRVPGRQSLQQVTIFKSLGMAVEDVAAADLAFRRAVAQGIGSEVRTS